jgi:3-hydroxyanthranilate 3,4-dioxygenase
MAVISPFNLKKWVDEHRHILKPPVGNAQVYKDVKDFIIMIVGGPNARKDYHYNESEEFFYQLEGDITVKIIDEGEPKDIHIKEGEMFLLPGKTPHSPQRGPNTIGMVIERVRPKGTIDGFMWFCENCGNKLYEEYFEMTDIVKQLPPIMERFYSNLELRTCSNCGTVMEPPKKVGEEQKTH